MTDEILTIMLMLKNNWSLTGDLDASSIVFTTRFYDKNIQLPQIAISPVGGTASPPVDFGASEATYPDFQLVNFEIYVRPKTDSVTNLGWAKNAIYRIRQEVERILRSGSHIDTNVDTNTFLQLIGWRRKDNLTVRPPLFALIGNSYVMKYLKGR